MQNLQMQKLQIQCKYCRKWSNRIYKISIKMNTHPYTNHFSSNLLIERFCKRKVFLRIHCSFHWNIISCWSRWCSFFYKKVRETCSTNIKYFSLIFSLFVSFIESRDWTYRTCFEHVENIGIRFIESIDKEQTSTIFATHLQAFFVALFATKTCKTLIKFRQFRNFW